MEIGKQVMLGRVYKEFVMANNTTIPIKRMSMNSELLFTDLYNSFVKHLASMQSDLMSTIRDAMSGAVRIGIMEGLGLVGQVVAQLPKVQDFAIDAVLMICHAHKINVTDDEIRDGLGTADCFEILAAQAEAQGILGAFRSILAGLSTLSQGK